MFYLGIDLGKDGGLALLNNEGKCASVRKPPLIKGAGKVRDEHDIPGMAGMLMEFITLAGEGNLKVILEKAQAMPKMYGGSLASFVKGYSSGLWHGLLVALGIPYEIVAPQTWQRVMFRDLPRQDTKQASVMVAQRLFPDMDFKRPGRSRKMDDGLTDALLIAIYGFRKDRGQK